MKTINLFSTVSCKSFFRFFSTLVLSCVLAFSSMSFTSDDMLEEDCPVAGFSVLNNGSTYTTPIIFTNQSTGADSYHWDFGDGNSTCEENPIHTYSAPGTYTVTLRAINGECPQGIIGTTDVLIM